MCETIFTAPGSFSDEKYYIEKNTHLMLELANIVAFLLQNFTQQDIIPLRICKSFHAFTCL